MLAHRVEYQTWAGMIVTQYGRIPGDQQANGIHYGGSHGGSPPRQSAALDKLQRYYGTGDTCSEPEDFKPGQETHLPLPHVFPLYNLHPSVQTAGASLAGSSRAGGECSRREDIQSKEL